MSQHPIPDTALDDRLGFVGTAGSGKTYAAGGAAERAMAKKGRIIVPDPLGVWWGLRLLEDGKTASSYNVVIFGGPRGDLPINEHAGALIGETVAGMAESAIVDLSLFGTKASERRFMLAFLMALYKHASSEPVHLIFDEADMWAPQRLLDKEGEAAKLQGMMETIVRRGRIKGFIPWLITQRPAVLSKDVLSQVDGLVALKLTSSQDRDAIGAWIEGQADRQEGKRILGSLPAMQKGQGVVWVPGRGILETVDFPKKKTFDSSRTPKRGERAAEAKLQPIDLGKLREKLATVEAEAKANDPRLLKAEIAKLKKELASNQGGKIIAPDPKATEAARKEAYTEGHAAGYLNGMTDIGPVMSRVGMAIADLETAFEKLQDRAKAAPSIAPRNVYPGTSLYTPAPVAQRRPSKPLVAGSSPAGRANGTLPPARQKILDGLAWLETIGTALADKTALAHVVGVSSTSGGYFNNLGALRAAGLIDYPEPSMVVLTEEGRAQATAPDAPLTHEAIMALVAQRLPPAQVKILDAVAMAYPKEVEKTELAAKVGVSPTSGGYFNNLGRLRTLGLITYPRPNAARADDRLFP